MLWNFLSSGPAQTNELGRRMGRACGGGEVILLDGPLGAGKSCVTAGIAQGLEIMETVISPSYVILRSYRGRRSLTLHHLDFYRLRGDEDLQTVGFEDCFDQKAVIVVEWPGRCPAAFRDFTLFFQIDIVDETTRRFRAYAGGLAPGELSQAPGF